MTHTMMNPFDCRLWDLHDRLDDFVTAETCSSEIESFSRYGQLVPTLGRPLKNDPDHKVELIYGARRLFVARYLNMPLKVDLRPLSDREAIVAMDIENRQRKDICPYERGSSFLKWIHHGHFKSQDEIARALKISASQVSRLISLARLPTVIVEAFTDPAEMCEGWGLEIASALEDSEKRRAIIDSARSLIRRTPRLHGREVCQALLSAVSPGKKPRLKRRDEVVSSGKGIPLFRVQYRSRSIALQVPLSKLSKESVEQIRLALVRILDRDVAYDNPVQPTCTPSYRTQQRDSS